MQGGLHPGIGGLHLGVGGLGRPPRDTTRYGQPAGGAHPTGIHSCLLSFCSDNFNQSL